MCASSFPRLLRCRVGSKRHRKRHEHEDSRLNEKAKRILVKGADVKLNSLHFAMDADGCLTPIDFA